MKNKIYAFSFQNGLNAPHMLGNQLNPSSVMAQKMCDTLSQEMVAHSVFTQQEPTQNNSLVGPQLHRPHHAQVSFHAQSINLIHSLIFLMWVFDTMFENMYLGISKSIKSLLMKFSDWLYDYEFLNLTRYMTNILAMNYCILIFIVSKKI